MKRSVILICFGLITACVQTERHVIRLDGVNSSGTSSVGSSQSNRTTAIETEERDVVPLAQSEGIIAIVPNPSVSSSQALAICEPRARSMAAQSGSVRSDRPSRAYCRRDYFGNYDCRETGSSGGFQGGFYSALADGLRERRLRNSLLQSCLAEYGWRQR